MAIFHIIEYLLGYHSKMFSSYMTNTSFKWKWHIFRIKFYFDPSEYGHTIEWNGMYFVHCMFYDVFFLLFHSSLLLCFWVPSCEFQGTATNNNRVCFTLVILCAHLWTDNNMSLDGHNNCVFGLVYVSIRVFPFCLIFMEFGSFSVFLSHSFFWSGVAVSHVYLELGRFYGNMMYWWKFINALFARTNIGSEFEKT